MVQVNILDYRGETLNKRFLAQALPRAAETHADIERRVAELLETVAEGGAGRRARLHRTLRRRARRDPAGARSEPGHRRGQLDPKVRIPRSSSRSTRLGRSRPISALPDVRTQLASGAFVTHSPPAGRACGTLCAGGLAVYPSTVIMNVVPAPTAGADSLAIASPPQADGLPHPTVLATAHILGVDEVWAMGGAQAIGALAYGFDGRRRTRTRRPHHRTRERLCGGREMTREVPGRHRCGGRRTAIASSSPTRARNPRFVAADLISQAEHDELAASVLITWNFADLAEAVVAEGFKVQVPAAMHSERISTALSGRQSPSSSSTTSTRASPWSTATRVNTSRSTPPMPPRWPNGSPAGERCSLATLHRSRSATTAPVRTTCSRRSGTAAHGSGLGVHSFIKVSQVIDYDRQALSEVAEHIDVLAARNKLRPMVAPWISGSRSRDALSVLPCNSISASSTRGRRRRRRSDPQTATMPPLRSPLHHDGGHESVGDQTLRGHRGVLAAEDHVGRAQGLQGRP